MQDFGISITEFEFRATDPVASGQPEVGSDPPRGVGPPEKNQEVDSILEQFGEKQRERPHHGRTSPGNHARTPGMTTEQDHDSTGSKERFSALIRAEFALVIAGFIIIIVVIKVTIALVVAVEIF